ncbi:MAG: hypothetical protein WA828_14520, partial [Coleofasciculaceae cyanobacterium]
MTQALFLKNLPAPLQFWVRPMLLASLALHGLLLVMPTSSKDKPKAPTKKEPEKVKITQLPTAPKPPTAQTPLAVVKPSPVIPKPSVAQPNPIRPPAITPPIPPVTRSKPRPTTPPPTPSEVPTPLTSPTPVASASPTPTPSEVPTPLTSPTPVASASPTPSNPFDSFPFPKTAQLGSLGLLSGDNDKSARNTAEALSSVVAFYDTELPANKFTSTPLTNEADLKVYQVSPASGAPQFLHLISQDGKTVILLASQQVSDLKSLKDAGTRSAEEIAFYDNVLTPIEKDDNLILNTVEPSDVAKIPESAKFADQDKFRPLVKTGNLAPKSPEELAAIYANQLNQQGFTQISKEAPYGGAIVYKVTQGQFKAYLYFVTIEGNY